MPVEVYSSGIFAQDGEMAAGNAITVMKEKGIDLTKHKAINIRKTNIQNMDLILCATESHKTIVKELYPNLKEKVYTILEYADNRRQDKDLPDPWGNDIQTYKKCAEEIEESIEKIVEKITR